MIVCGYNAVGLSEGSKLMGHLAHLAIRERFRSTRLRSCKAELRSSSPSPRWRLAKLALAGDAKFVVYCGKTTQNDEKCSTTGLRWIKLMHFSHSKDNTSIMQIFFPACVVASPCCRCTEQIVVNITGLATRRVPQNGTSF